MDAPPARGILYPILWDGVYVKTTIGASRVLPGGPGEAPGVTGSVVRGTRHAARRRGLGAADRKGGYG